VIIELAQQKPNQNRLSIKPTVIIQKLELVNYDFGKDFL
jgi:hypothetical protein